MKKINWPIIFSILAALVILWFILFQSSKNGDNRWQETYFMQDEEPYGGYVISKLLNHYFNSAEITIVKKPLQYVLDTNAINNNYIFIGDYLHSDYKGKKQLLSFVRNGNNALLACNEFDQQLLEHIFNPVDPLEDSNVNSDDNAWPEENQSEAPDAAIEKQSVDTIDTLATNQDSLLKIDSTIFSQKDSTAELLQTIDSVTAYYSGFIGYYRDSVVEMNFIHPSLKRYIPFDYLYIQYHDSIIYGWQYFDTSSISQSSTSCIAIGSLEKDRINFIKIKYGKGTIYLHSNPIVFTNYNLLKEKQVKYAENVFSHLPNSKTYYDDYNKRYRYQDSNSGNTDSPLQYIFSQPQLKWAYYLIVALLLIFILFRAKRKQRIIPILKSNTNTSLEYVQTIGTLYFKTGEHKKIALQKMKVFLSQIRSRYKVQTRDLDDSFAKQLSLKSKVPVENINEIIKRYKFLESLSTADEQILIDFYQSIETFYKNCA